MKAPTHNIMPHEIGTCRVPNISAVWKQRKYKT